MRTTLLIALAAALVGASNAALALDDAEIAHVAYTAGSLDVAAAKLALEKTRDPEIRAFAETMVRDHEAVNRKALALVEKLGVTPQDNDVSRSLSTAAAAELVEQRALAGGAFDRAYVANEVAYHAQVNEALRTTLIPGARNAELKALLESGLVLFSAHQQHAEHLDAALDERLAGAR